jgi:hypothetical protein
MEHSVCWYQFLLCGESKSVTFISLSTFVPASIVTTGGSVNIITGQLGSVMKER